MSILRERLTHAAVRLSYAGKDKNSPIETLLGVLAMKLGFIEQWSETDANLAEAILMKYYELGGQDDLD